MSPWHPGYVSGCDLSLKKRYPIAHHALYAMTMTQ